MDTAERGDTPERDAAPPPRRTRLPALRSIRVQLPLAMLVIAGALLVAVLGIALTRAVSASRAARESVLREHVGAVGRLLAEYLRQGTVDQVRTALDEFAGAISLSAAVVIDPDDRVMASTREEWSGWTYDRTTFTRTRPLIERARREGRAVDGELPADRFVVVVPLVAPGTDPRAATPRAWLLLAEFDLQPFLGWVRHEILRFFLLTVTIALTGLLLMGMFLHQRVTRPASRLADAAERIASGDRSARVGLTGEDELGRAAQAFDLMAARIEEAESALRRQQVLLDGLLRALPVGVLSVSRAERRVLFTNPRWRDLFGIDVPTGDAHERVLADMRFFHRDGTPLPAAELAIPQALATGRPVGPMEVVAEPVPGTRVPLVVRAEPVCFGEGDEFDAVVAVMQDRRDFERLFEELRLSERRFETLFEALPVGVLMVDRATRTVMYANRRLRELCGVDSPTGRPIERLGGRRETTDGRPFPLDELPVERVLAEGGPVEVDDLVFVHDDGERVPVVTVARPMNLAGGPEFDTVAALVQDRRDLERAFEELRHSEARFASLLDALPVGVFMVDRATRTVLYANRRLEELCGVEVPLGRAIHLLEGRKETEAGKPYPQERLPVERVLEGHRAVQTDDLVYVRPDGTRVQAVTQALPVSISGEPGFDAVIAVIQDRRDLERAFAELKAWEERFQNVSHAIGQAIYEWDLTADHLRFSDSLTSVFGYAASEVDSNVKWNTVTHPDDLAAVKAEMQASLRERRTFDAVYRLRHRDGRWRWVRDRGLPRFDEAGAPVLLTGAVADITEQRELEARFRQAQKMETVGTLAGGIAHDFNNQLTGVLGHLDLLRDELPAADARQDHVRIARLAAERCAELTRGLLAFSRMLRGEPRPVDVNATLEETAALLRRALPSTIRLELRAGEGLPPALVDPNQLQQVLINLCVNARDAMPEGGRLRLSTSQTSVGPEAAIAAGAIPGDYVVIEVADDGAGISPEVLPRIFEPFYTTKPVGIGTGLGLAMVYGIVTQHQGWVSVDSGPGRGTAFRVHLPVAVGGAAPAPAAEPAEAATASRLVLVVDDEPIVREFAVRLLERAGCTVLQAGDGTEAVARLSEHALAVEAVLLDLSMPGRPVRDVVRALRRIAPGVRIVLTSGYSEEVAGVPEFAGLTFLPKPFTPGQLLEAMCAPGPAGPRPGEA